MPRYDTPDPITVSTDVAHGTVTVVAAERVDTVVEVRPSEPSKQQDVDAAAATRVELDGATLTVATPRELRAARSFRGTPSIEVTIEVPSGSALTGEIASGRLEGRGRLGRCGVRVAAGEVRLEEAGPLELTLAEGDVAVDRPLESMTATTSKGDVRVGSASHGVLRLETSMGEIEVGIAEGSAVRLEADAGYGRVTEQAPPVDPSGAHETVEVHARNAYGNVVVRPAAARG